MKPINVIDQEIVEVVSSKIIAPMGQSVFSLVNHKVWNQTWNFIYSMRFRQIRDIIINNLENGFKNGKFRN
jgi:hypothetical protein